MGLKESYQKVEWEEEINLYYAKALVDLSRRYEKGEFSLKIYEELKENLEKMRILALND